MCKEGKRILIVEDTSSIAVLVSATLRRDGLNVDVANTAKEAMSKFVTSLDGPIPYDLLLVDLNLPDGDGAGLLAQMASLDACPPSFVVSADGSASAKKRAKAAGAEQFFEKPFNLTLLKSEIERKVGDLHQTIDGQKLSKLEAMEQSLVENYQRYLVTLASDLEGKMTFKQMSSLLHQLKGSANLYGFKRLSELASSLSTSLVNQGPVCTCSIRKILRQELAIELVPHLPIASCKKSVAV